MFNLKSTKHTNESLVVKLEVDKVGNRKEENMVGLHGLGNRYVADQFLPIQLFLPLLKDSSNSQSSIYILYVHRKQIDYIIDMSSAGQGLTVK